MSERYRLASGGERVKAAGNVEKGLFDWQRGRQPHRPCLLGLLAPPRRSAPHPSRLPCCLPRRKRCGPLALQLLQPLATHTPVSPGGSLLLSRLTTRVVYEGPRSRSRRPALLPALPSVPTALPSEASVFSVNLEEIKRDFRSFPNQLTVHLDLGPWI